MRKYMLALFTAVLIFSCSKNKRCWIVSDCLGNDISGFCGSESEVQAHCQANSSPGCPWGYRPA